MLEKGKVRGRCKFRIIFKFRGRSRITFKFRAGVGVGIEHMF